MFCRHLSPAFGVAVWLAATNVALAAQEPKLRDEPNLTDGQKEEFLLKAQDEAEFLFHRSIEW